VGAFVTHFKKPDKHFYIKGLGYPINEELLKMLKNALIDYIIIPEDGVRDFKAYLAETKDYLNGMRIHEPLTEAQRCLPKNETIEIPMDRQKLERVLYGF